MAKQTAEKGALQPTLLEEKGVHLALANKGSRDKCSLVMASHVLMVAVVLEVADLGAAGKQVATG